MERAYSEVEEYHEKLFLYVESQTLPATGTQLLRSSSSDLAHPIAKRLGEEFIASCTMVDGIFCRQRDGLGNRYFYLWMYPFRWGIMAG
jgi:hypothetical protein